MAGCVNILPKTEVTIVPFGSPLKSRGTKAGSDTLSEITSTSIPLINGTTYRKLGITVTSQVDSCFQVIHEDDGVENIIWDGNTSPGQTTVDDEKDLSIVAGATGTQRLFVKASNADVNEVGDLTAMMTILST